MASHIMNCIKSPPPLELNWQFQAPIVRGFFRHKFLSFMKCFQIFMNVNILFFLRNKNFRFEKLIFLPKKYIYFVTNRNEHPAFASFIYLSLYSFLSLGGSRIFIKEILNERFLSPLFFIYFQFTSIYLSFYL